MTLALLLVLAAAPAPQSWKFETDGSPEVHISNIEGSVTVEGTDGNIVYFEIFRESDNNSPEAYPVEVVQDGDEIRARVCCGACEEGRKSSLLCNEPGKVRFVVKVPRSTELHVSAVNAPIKVAGVEGEQEISSVNGRVDVAGSKKALSVSAVSGGVALAPEQVDDIAVSTVSGDVSMKLPERVDAQLGFSSVSGSFNGKSVTLGSVEKTWGKGTHEIGVSTVSGSLVVGSRN